MTFFRDILRHIAATSLIAGFLGIGTAVAQQAETLDTNGENLALETNKGVLLRLERPATDIFIANPEIADVQVKSPQLIYVFGVAPGKTSLYALGENERPVYAATVTVTSNLTELKGLYEALLPQSRVDIQVINGMAMLRGIVPTAADAESAERYAKSFLGIDVVNQLSVVQPTQVNLRVKFAEVGRSTLKELGFNFESLFEIGDAAIGLATGRDIIGGIIDPSAVINNPALSPLVGGGLIRNQADSILFSGLTNNVSINGVLDALETEGLLSTLAEPNLTAVSGQTATFLAGGEFPVPIPQEEGLAIQFKEFGVRLAFTPVVLSDRKISLRVNPEVSQLTNAGAVNIAGTFVPALSTRRVETTVELGSGQSFAVAGLIQNNITQDLRKTPFLGDIPILGALFRSDAFRHDETELVVITTPYIVKPVDARRIASPLDGQTLPSDADRYIRNDMITYAPRTIEAPGAGREGPALVGRAGFRLK